VNGYSAKDRASFLLEFCNSLLAFSSPISDMK